jgi:hypothetical protein
MRASGATPLPASHAVGITNRRRVEPVALHLTATETVVSGVI